jgi:hypothetical protein
MNIEFEKSHEREPRESKLQKSSNSYCRETGSEIMAKGSPQTSESIQRIEQARKLLDDALFLLQKAKGDSGARIKGAATPKRSVSTSSLSFSLNQRAFMKKHARLLSGSKKFTLLLAHSVKGKVGEVVSVEKLVSEWNRMKGVLGGAFNPAHATRAKENGWIDSPKKGAYALSTSWKEVLKN